MKKWLIWVSASVAAVMLLGFGCVEDEGEQRVELETWLVGVGGDASFINEPPSDVEPWTVTLTEAVAALGPVYLFEGEPLLGRFDLRQLLLPRAYAHPGHYQEGEALGELREQVVIDLLDPEPTRLGMMSAVTGECHSAQIGVGSAESGLAGAEQLEGHALLVRGEAARGDELIPFEASIDLEIFVEGLDFEHEIDDSPGHLAVEVDLRRWLRRVDFSTTTPGDGEEGLAIFEEGTQAHNALSRGVDNTLAYGFAWVADEER